MALVWTIGKRFLMSRRNEGAVSLITRIALAGVILGVAALVIAMAVMNGYRANLLRAMAGSLPHVSLHPMKKSGFDAPAELEDFLWSSVKPLAVTPFIMAEGLMRAGKGRDASIHGVMIRGILPEEESGGEDFMALLDDGSPEWGGLPPEERLERSRAMMASLAAKGAGEGAPVLLSKTLARKMGIWLGDSLTPMAFPESGEGFSPRPTGVRLKVAGFFETGIVTFDELVLVMHLETATRVLPGEGSGLSLGLRLEEPLRAGEVARELRRQAMGSDSSYYVYSWLESNKGLFQVILFQKVMLFLVLMLIVIIAFFGMVSALTMLVAEKSKEIAILKSLGLEEGVITAIFRAQGLAIGAAGTLLGLGLGLGVCLVLSSFPLIDIPPGVYPGTDRIPVLLDPMDILAVVAGTMAVCLTATIFPARKAGKLRPAEGLRYG